MSKVKVYIRERCGSIDEQLAAITVWAEEHGHEILGHYVDHANEDEIDQGLPGPAMADLLTGIVKDELVVIQHAGVLETVELTVECMMVVRKRGGKLIALEGELIPKDDVLANVLLSHHLYIREFRREISRSRMRQHQQNGRPINNKPPYGWRIIFKNRQWRLEPDEEEQAIYRKVIQWHAETGNKKEVLRRLEKEGLKARCGRPFQYNTIRRLLDRYKESQVPSLAKFDRIDQQV